jgi:drug/metabolite transporter (DMT)-like permease
LIKIETARTSSLSHQARAKLLVVLLGVLWGWNWVASKIALQEVGPWSLRIAGLGLATLTLFAMARVRGSSLAIPRGRPRLHVAVAALFNVAAFNMFTALAQLGAPTSRVVIIAYTMPIWATLLSFIVLRESLMAVRLAAMVLCVLGLTVLVAPLITASAVPHSLLYALGGALGWAAGTVYLKWARIEAPPLAVATAQLAIGTACIVACALVFEGPPQLWPLQWQTIAALAYNGMIGMGLAYLLWFDVITRLPAATASLGVLIVPVVGVASSALILSERPSVADLAGFALIFAAAACALLPPGRTPSRPAGHS